MTLSKFNRLLKKIDPKLRVRQRAYGDVVGLFAGKSARSGYILRMTKGELTLAGYREMIVDPTDIFSTKKGIIKKRGRKTVINLLKNWRWIKTHQQKSMLLWGIEK